MPLLCYKLGVNIPAGVKAEFTTTIKDLSLVGFDFEIQTCCTLRYRLLIAQALARDTTMNPVFAKMLDRWATVRGPEWLAEHIIQVQRQLAFELALSRLTLVA